MDNGAPESSAGASQPRHFASPDALSNPQLGSAPNSNPFALTLVHRPKLSDSDIDLTGGQDTTNASAPPPTSPSKRAASVLPPSSKHVTAATAAVSVASILSNSHSRYSQQQFDEESTGGDGDYDHGNDHDEHNDLGFALDVDLEHDYVLARGGGKGVTKRGHHHSKSFPSSRPKHRVPVKTGRAFTRKVQHRRVGSGGRSGSGGGLSLGLGLSGRAAGGAPLAADGFEDLDPGFDLGLGLGGVPLTASSNGIGGRLQRLKENRHRRFASQQRVRRGRGGGGYHNLHGQHNWSLQHIASLLSGSNDNNQSTEPPALHYVTAHSVWTALQALPGFLFDESVGELFEEDSDTNDHGIVRLLGTILADPAIVCTCDKSTCRGRNTGLPQFVVVLFALAPTLHSWQSLSQPPWTIDSNSADMESNMHDGINAMMADFGIDDMGDGDMGNMCDTDMSGPQRTTTALASETDNQFWAWLADAVFGQFPGSNKENNNSGNGNDNNHAPGLVEDRSRPAWITDAYSAPDIGHKLWALVQLFVGARRRFLEEEANEMDDGTSVDIDNLSEIPAHLLSEHSQTHPCRWGSPLTCKDPICFQDGSDASAPMQCCPLHDQRIGLAVDVWCLWVEEGRRTLEQSLTAEQQQLTRPAQQTHRALVEWKEQLDQRDRLHQSAVVEQLQRQ